MGNPMKVGQIPRRNWATCSTKDTREALTMIEEEGDESEEDECAKDDSYEWEFVRDGGGAANVFRPLNILSGRSLAVALVSMRLRR